MSQRRINTRFQNPVTINPLKVKDPELQKKLDLIRADLQEINLSKSNNIQVSGVDQSVDSLVFTIQTNNQTQVERYIKKWKTKHHSCACKIDHVSTVAGGITRTDFTVTIDRTKEQQILLSNKGLLGPTLSFLTSICCTFIIVQILF